MVMKSLREAWLEMVDCNFHQDLHLNRTLPDVV
jgi:hypothetical protein